MRAHRGQSAPPGSTVPGCQTMRVFIVQLPHTRIPHLVATPVFWANVSLRCQDSSFPSQTRGIVFAEHFRRRAAGERCRQSFSSHGGSALRSLVSRATSLDIAPTSSVVAAARRSQCRTPPLQRLRRATTLPSRFVGSERHSIPRTRRKSRSTTALCEAMAGCTNRSYAAGDVYPVPSYLLRSCGTHPLPPCRTPLG